MADRSALQTLAPEITDQIERLDLRHDIPLVVVDVDEVLALFVEGFGRFVASHGLEMRLQRFALFQNLYRPGESAPITLEEGRALFDAYFALDRHDLDATPGAAAALSEIARVARIVILTNAPAASRDARERWLDDHGLAYDLVIGAGPKGAPVAAMAERSRAGVAFVDDLLVNLDSVAEAAPSVRRFQMVADVRLRAMAPTAPERHTRIDDWAKLAPAITASIGR